LGQALLLVGPAYTHINEFLECFVGELCCDSPILTSPCGQCKSCLLYKHGSHPDIITIQVDDVIKVDMIRDLQDNIYQKPQCNLEKLILIQDLRKLNVYAANALLKILEEPPEHVRFILTTPTISLIPATILTRVLVYNFPSSYEQISSFYPKDSQQGELLAYMQSLSQDLMAQKNLLSWSAKLKGYELADLLWFFYLVIYDLLLKVVDTHSQILFKKLDFLKNTSKLFFSKVVLNKAMVIDSFLF
jgi:DNA polymerase III subunit delta'